jgi:hypothetical protein
VSSHSPHSFLQAQQQFLKFLQNFYNVFPEYKRMDVSAIICSDFIVLNPGRPILLARVSLDNGYHTMVRQLFPILSESPAHLSSLSQLTPSFPLILVFLSKELPLAMAGLTQRHTIEPTSII